MLPLLLFFMLIFQLCVDKKISDFTFKIVETTKDADDLKRALCCIE
jgi:hypothetical protein